MKDKEKQIEEMAKVIKEAIEPIEYGIGEVHYPTEEEIAEALYNAGYRNCANYGILDFVKQHQEQAVKEFAEIVWNKIVNLKRAREDTNIKLVEQGKVCKIITETLNEFIGAKE